jgi:esterase/lipase superfamily enzyme
MNREYQKWKSPSLGRDMEMLIFGKEGTPVIIFPQANGRFFEWEDEGGIDAVEEQIEKGYNQFFCVDNVADESFLNQDVDPYVRVMRENQYEMYLIDEVLPFISEENSNPYVITAGAGLGAYHAMKLGLKQPGLFDKVIAMSGYFDINVHLDGFKDENSYYHNPIEFLPNLNDEKILNAISAIDIRLISYLNDPNREPSQKMSDTLWMKFINHNYYVWEEETENPWSLYPGMLKDNLI